ncbi:MAG: N-acetylmuramoyl-L-alanine amidase [Treponema sp.]|uniref:N-acetylmuramoyl-L-alanine amidase n=1 Tax=Treponema sp. TaxID=166 RepID=UPI00257DA93C|nr:N-acetylmuramoyl-L-alanine amidase [Treponema sp.]MBQ5536763.1 N-acetylmuramoyl-L-alanine amidase [Treponema sp.]
MRRFFSFFVALLANAFAVASNASNVSSINLLSESQKLGFSVQWDSLSASGIIERAGHRVSFRADDPFVLQDCRKMELSDAPEIRDGVLYVSQRFIDSVSRFLRDSAYGENSFRVKAILIDPGHGGKDPGAMATHKSGSGKIQILEKDVNLRASLLLYEKLKAAYPDKQILLTRRKDIDLPLDKRTEIANSIKLSENEAAIFVSVHSNSSPDKRASEYEVWYLDPAYRRTVLEKGAESDSALYNIVNAMMEEEFTMESMIISKLIIDGIQAQVGTEANLRGIKSEEWYVVRNSNMPAVLIELGFVSNEDEARKLLDDDYLKKLSLGIYNGLSAFVTHFERSHGFTEMN